MSRIIYHANMQLDLFIFKRNVQCRKNFILRGEGRGGGGLILFEFYISRAEYVCALSRAQIHTYIYFRDGRHNAHTLFAFPIITDKSVIPDNSASCSVVSMHMRNANTRENTRTRICMRISASCELRTVMCWEFLC